MEKDTDMEPAIAAVAGDSTVMQDGDEVEDDVVVDGGSDRSGKRSSGDRVKGLWSPAEDYLLGQLVANYGARNWSLIARGIPGRSGKSCRLRWCNQLDPSVKRKPFTENLYQPLTPKMRHLSPIMRLQGRAFSFANAMLQNGLQLTRWDVVPTCRPSTDEMGCRDIKSELGSSVVYYEETTA